jgi:hypothetical protein
VLDEEMWQASSAVSEMINRDKNRKLSVSPCLRRMTGVTTSIG